MNDEKTNEETVEEILESDLEPTIEEDADTVQCRLERARRAFAARRSLAGTTGAASGRYWQ